MNYVQTLYKVKSLMSQWKSGTIIIAFFSYFFNRWVKYLQENKIHFVPILYLKQYDAKINVMSLIKLTVQE